MNKIRNIMNDVKSNISPVAMNVCMFGMMMVQNSSLAAEADAKGLVETIIKIIGVLIIAYGMIMAVMGVIAYASAHSEGDGPAQNKAVGKISAGVMLVVLSIILSSQAGKLAGMIQTSI